MKNKILYILFLFILLSSCKKGVEFLTKNNNVDEHDLVIHNIDSGYHVFIGGDYFLTSEADYLTRLGNDKIKEGQYDLAKEYFLEALSIEENNPIILNNLGLVMMNQIKYFEAEEYFLKSFISSDSTYINANLNLGLLHCQNGKYQESIEVLKYIQSVSNEEYILANSSLILSNVYMNIFKCKEALNEFKKAYAFFKRYDNFHSVLNTLHSDIQECFKEIK